MKKQTRNKLIIALIVVGIVALLYFNLYKPLGFIGAVRNSNSFDTSIPIRTEIFQTMGCNINNPHGQFFNYRSGSIQFGDGIIETYADNRPYLQVQVDTYYENFFDKTTRKNFYTIYDVVYRNADDGKEVKYLFTILDDNVKRQTPSMDDLPECQNRRCQIFWNVYYCPYDYTPPLKIPIQDVTLGFTMPQEPILEPTEPPIEDVPPEYPEQVKNDTTPTIPTEPKSDIQVLYYVIGGIAILSVILYLIYLQTNSKRRRR